MPSMFRMSAGPSPLSFITLEWVWRHLHRMRSEGAVDIDAAAPLATSPPHALHVQRVLSRLCPFRKLATGTVRFLTVGGLFYDFPRISSPAGTMDE